MIPNNNFDRYRIADINTTDILVEKIIIVNWTWLLGMDKDLTLDLDMHADDLILGFGIEGNTFHQLC